MKNKVYLIIIVAILAVSAYGAYRYYSKPNGSTVESREELLNSTSEGIKWKIAQEQKLEDYLVSSIYSSTKSGIAVFKANGDEKYKLAFKKWGNSDEIVTYELIIGEEWYDLIWFNGAETAYAEIIYSVDGAENEPIIFDVSDMRVICSKAPAKDYILTVRYYDNDGNVYE